MRVPILQQAKIQAQVLVPLVEALTAELGKERAHALVRNALGAHYRQLGERWWHAKGRADLGEAMASAFAGYAEGGALDYEVHEQSPDTFAIDVKQCGYAAFYKELGAPELGFLFVCSADFDLAEGFGGDVALTRTQTIMQGASHCDFRYSRRSKTA